MENHPKIEEEELAGLLLGDRSGHSAEDGFLSLFLGRKGNSIQMMWRDFFWVGVGVVFYAKSDLDFSCQAVQGGYLTLFKWGWTFQNMPNVIFVLLGKSELKKTAPILEYRRLCSRSPQVLRCWRQDLKDFQPDAIPMC